MIQLLNRIFEVLMLFIDDIFLSVGMILICAAAFKWDFTGGLLVTGICFIMLAILTGIVGRR